jgi:3-isopropylmalate dehydrogenase
MGLTNRSSSKRPRLAAQAMKPAAIHRQMRRSPLAKQADVVFAGRTCVGPEQGILRLRKELKLFANLRPAVLYDELVGSSPLKPGTVRGLHILIVRELIDDVFFGQPRGKRKAPDGEFAGEREGFDTMRYSEPGVVRMAHVAFEAARTRRKNVCSVDKANVLQTSQL